MFLSISIVNFGKAGIMYALFTVGTWSSAWNIVCAQLRCGKWGNKCSPKNWIGSSKLLFIWYLYRFSVEKDMCHSIQVGSLWKSWGNRLIYLEEKWYHVWTGNFFLLPKTLEMAFRACGLTAYLWLYDQ